MANNESGDTERGIFDFITADTPEGEEFAEALREETAVVEMEGVSDNGAATDKE